MLTSAYSERCGQCSGKMIDIDDELVCVSCASVTTKEIIEHGEDKKPQAIDYTRHSLGSFLGPLDYGYQEKHSKLFSSSSSTFKYLKTISDYTHKESGAVYSCAKMMERICEKLLIPKAMIGQSMVIAKTLLQMRRTRGQFTTATISAFSIITACKLYGIASVGVKEVIEAHRALGHRVKISTIIQMSIDSPVKIRPRKAEEYLSRVIAHLPSNAAFRMKITENGLSEPAYYHRLLGTAKRILEMVNGSARGGHNPCAMAATSVYAAEILLSRMESRKRFLSQKDSAECVDTAEYTVREQYGEIFRPRMEEMYEAVRAPMTPTHIHSTQKFQTLPEQNPVLP